MCGLSILSVEMSDEVAVIEEINWKVKYFPLNTLSLQMVERGGLGFRVRVLTVRNLGGSLSR